MTAPNRNTLWATAIIDELVAAGVDSVVVSPGSRSTPLTMAAARNETLHVYSVLDERSAAYFALGRARRTGRVTPLICTSGTAAANYHPAVMEASNANVPLLALTADRPPELRNSGANQTADQVKLYGDAVRFYADLPEPAANDRTLRSVRTTVSRAIAVANAPSGGPVHLNVPFKKPLEPTPVPGDVPVDLDPTAEFGRDGPYVDVTSGTPEPSDTDVLTLADALAVDRGLIVAGPSDPPGLDPESVTALAHATGYPILADPLSGLRFGGHTRVTPVIGGYDAFVSGALGTGKDTTRKSADDSTAGASEGSWNPSWSHPDVVVRLGGSPTSKRLRNYLAAIDADQFVVDPAGRWREAEFTATDLVVADPNRLCARLAASIGSGRGASWREQWTAAERLTRRIHAGQPATEDDDDSSSGSRPIHEGDVLRAVVAELPDPATLFVSNSMPVRDLDRYVSPSTTNVTVLGNRGVSGIDGIVSTALGAGSGTTDDLTLVIGDVALHHDTNGLLAIGRCGVEATIVVVNNDGGGIFHGLPIETYEPTFTEQFKTPHGLDFEPAAAHHGLDYSLVELTGATSGGRDDGASLRTAAEATEAVAAAYASARETDGSSLVEVRTNGESSQRIREGLVEEVERAVHGDTLR